MIGYAEKEVFTPKELSLWQRAVNLVEKVPYELRGESIRCHELARAVGRVLGLDHEDGKFGFVEHTWLWVEPLDRTIAPWVMPNVIDVYVPGSVPSVQLVHMATGLPTRYFLASVSDLQIRTDVMQYLSLHFAQREAGLI